MTPRARIVLLLIIALSMVLIATSTAGAVSLTADEQYMLNMLNKERRANGLTALEVDPQLTYMARRYCQEMITHKFFSHTSPISGELLDRVVASGVPDGWLIAGENLAGAPTVEAAFKGLMNSPSHKENMLESKYTHVGIGVVDGGDYGKMFAQEFIAYPKSMLYKSNDPSTDLLIYVNDTLLYSNPPAFIRQGRTLVPVRQLFEEFGAAVTWDSESNQIVINCRGTDIVLTAGDTLAWVNDKPILLDTPPLTRNSSAFVPLRFIAESIGATITWNNTLRTVDVELPKNPEAAEGS